MLMTKNAHWIWRSAFHNERGLPECPEDMTEPQYASFIFDPVCSIKVKQCLILHWGLDYADTYARRMCSN